jgi:hypothetical protein
MNPTANSRKQESLFELNASLWSYLVYDAFCEAVKSRNTELTVIGYINGELHVPKFGWIL